MLLYGKKEKRDKGEKKELGLKEWGMILGAGVLLLTLSVPEFFGNDTKEEQQLLPLQTVQTDTETTEGYVRQLEQRLEQLLSHVEGAGMVQVMITVQASKEKIVLKDLDYRQETTTEQDGAGGVRTIVQTEQQEESIKKQASGEELPYVIKELEPEVEGVVVIAEGSKKGTVDLDIVEAVQALFDLPAHKIKVLKME